MPEVDNKPTEDRPIVDDGLKNLAKSFESDRHSPDEGAKSLNMIFLDTSDIPEIGANILKTVADVGGNIFKGARSFISDLDLPNIEPKPLEERIAQVRQSFENSGLEIPEGLKIQIRNSITDLVESGVTLVELQPDLPRLSNTGNLSAGTYEQTQASDGKAVEDDSGSPD